MQTMTETQSPKSTFGQLKLNVEALLFASDAPLEAGQIRSWLGEVSLHDVRLALKAISKEYEDRAFELCEQEGRYQLRTRPEFTDLIKKQQGVQRRSLSRSALETLSIIAYKQPVTKAQVSALRQVDSSSIIQTLKERELIYASGCRKEVGNPLEYSTTEKFLSVFGLKNLADLPRLRSLQLSRDEQDQAKEALATLTNDAVHNNEVPPAEDEAPSLFAIPDEAKDITL